MWSTVATVRSGKRTFHPRARSMSKACGLVTSWTSPQAFDMLRARGGRVMYPERTIGTVDHIVPTSDQRRPFSDLMAEDMLSALERNCRDANIRLFDLDSDPRASSTSSGPSLA